MVGMAARASRLSSLQHIASAFRIRSFTTPKSDCLRSGSHKRQETVLYTKEEQRYKTSSREKQSQYVVVVSQQLVDCFKKGTKTVVALEPRSAGRALQYEYEYVCCDREASKLVNLEGFNNDISYMH